MDIMCLGLASLLLYGYWLTLKRVPVTPASDAALHIGSALNFYDALRDGQWIPRLQLSSAEWPDIPVYQYYDFLTGLIAAPWLYFGCSGLHAVALSLVLLRWIGLVALYGAIRLLSGSRGAGLAASILYAISPYCISTVFGRSAIPEAHAQSLIPVILLGWILLREGRWRQGTLTLAAAIFGMALAHNIFLLYGTILVGVLILVAPDFKVRLAAVWAVTAGLLLSAPQWLPALISRHDLSQNFTRANPVESSALTSLGGLWNSLQPIGGTQEYYFTFGWWTLPLFAATAILAYKKDRSALQLLVPNLLFFTLAWSPFDFWRVLPRVMWSVQFPYRLISFCSVLTAASLGLVWRRLGPPWRYVLLGIAVASQIQVYRDIPRHDFMNTTDEQLRQYLTVDYRVKPPPGQRRDILSGPWLWDENRFYASLPHEPTHILRVSGNSIFSDKTIKLWVARPEKRTDPLSNVAEIPPGLFDVAFQFPDTNKPLTLVASDYLVPHEVDPKFTDSRRLSVSISNFALDSDALRFSVIARTGHGYVRHFDLKAGLPPHPAAGAITQIELPIAYSRFLTARQATQVLLLSPSPTSLTIIKTTDLESPIEIRYDSPKVSWIMAATGLLLLCFLLRRSGTHKGTLNIGTH